MAILFANEVWTAESSQMTAAVKAREDFRDICHEMGFSELAIPIEDPQRGQQSIFKKLLAHVNSGYGWMRSFSKVEENDVVIVQFPLVTNTIFIDRAVKECHRRGAKLILFIHDLESIRTALRKDASVLQRTRLKLEERRPLAMCDALIVHNERMRQYVIEHFRVDASKVVSLGIFDYLISSADNNGSRHSLDRPIAITGTLRPHKAQYAYRLPNNVSFNLYGVGYEGVQNQNIHYFGAFPSDELPRIVEASFGLVWDGDSAETCSGVFGDYLRINNPHKTSFYLACGIPVIIWKEAALAELIEEKGLGLTVSSLHDLGEVLSNITVQDYEEIKENAERFALDLHAGMHTKKAIQDAISVI